MIAQALGFSGLALALAAAIGSSRPRIWLGLNTIGTAGGLGAGLSVLLTGHSWVWRGALILGGEHAYLRLDGISALFMVLVCLVGGLGALYAMEYWTDHHYPRSAAKGRAWWSVLVLSMILVLICSNGLHFLFVWEAFALSAYFLITLDHEKPEVRRAGWLYLAASHAGTMLLFAFFSALAAKTGNWDLGPMNSRTDLAPLFWLALFGFGVKAGMFPLHIWLPSAHSNAPSHVSAIMSAVAIKMGVYGIIRFSGWLPTPAGAGLTVLAIGAASAVLGIAFGLAQNDIKRLLAYCSVENIGIILIGLGLSLLAAQQGFPAWGQAALAGTFLHIVNHCLFKSLLFFGAGSVLHATGTRDMSRLGGLWRALPWTATLFALGAAAVSGLPPLNGFVGEWAIYQGLLRALVQKDVLGVAPVIMALAASGAMALAAFSKAVGIVFLGAPRSPVIVHGECGWRMLSPMLLLAWLMLCVGLLPGIFLRPVLGVTASWAPQWAASDPQIPTHALGQANTVLICILVAAGFMLLRRIRINGQRRGATWDCGYAAPTAHMQYTSGSFAGIVAGWFSWVLQPETRMRRVRGFFPERSQVLQRVPETVLEKAIHPAARTVMLAADAAKRLQHGRLQLYILYVFLGVTALGLLAFQGGM